MSNELAKARRTRATADGSMFFNISYAFPGIQGAIFSTLSLSTRAFLGAMIVGENKTLEVMPKHRGTARYPNHSPPAVVML